MCFLIASLSDSSKYSKQVIVKMMNKFDRVDSWWFGKQSPYVRLLWFTTHWYVHTVCLIAYFLGLQIPQWTASAYQQKYVVRCILCNTYIQVVHMVDLYHTNVRLHKYCEVILGHTHCMSEFSECGIVWKKMLTRTCICLHFPISIAWTSIIYSTQKLLLTCHCAHVIANSMQSSNDQFRCKSCTGSHISGSHAHRTPIQIRVRVNGETNAPCALF